VLYGKLRPYLNKHLIAEFDGICSTDIIGFRAIKPGTETFLNYFLGSNSFVAKASANSNGINLPRVSANIVSSFDFPLPPPEEQTEIVRRVESLFAKSDAIEAKYQSLKEKIEKLPQAILAKAFCGELVEQLDSDGDARELLEEIGRLKKR